MIANIIFVGIGGCIGAVLRYLCSVGLARVPTEFPLATMAVNLLGAFLIGFLSQLFSDLWPEKAGLKLFLTTGILGGFTTFSTFSLETVSLFQNGRPILASCSVLLTVAGGIVGALLGKIVAHRLCVR